MIRRWKIHIAALVALAALAACRIGSPAPPDLRTVTILHTNDVHAQLLPDDDGKGGWAAVAAYFKRVKEARDDVLILDAGDMTQGTPVSTFYQGKPIFEIMNAAGYDAATLGNHEFDNGAALIDEFREIAAFPILSASVWRAGKPLADAQTKVFSVNGIKIGIIGLTTDAFVDPEGLRFVEPEKAVRTGLAQLEGRADIVVALSHLGIRPARRLARAIEGLDVIIGGHSHTVLKEPKKVGDTVICQAGSRGRFVGELRLTVDRAARKVVRYEGRLVPIPVEGLAPDPETKAVVDRWEGKLTRIIDVKIGHNPARQSKRELKRNIERVWRQTYSTDFALQNLGGTRAALPAGDILIRHIYNILPFENSVFILTLTRDQIAEEVGAVTFAEDKPLYRLATNSFIGKLIAKKYHLTGERATDMEVSLRDPVIEFIKRNGHLNPVAAPKALVTTE